MSARTVSLIHGTRRLYRLRPNRQWMYALRDDLLADGFVGVSCFEWGGGVLRGFLAVDAPRYANELRRTANGRQVSIVAKSLGGIIAERAIALLQNDVRIDVFLRIAVPDARTAMWLPNVNRIVNVISPSDRLYRAGRLVAPLFLHETPTGRVADTIVLPGLSHYALTERTRCERTTTYELYRRILSGQAIAR